MDTNNSHANKPQRQTAENPSGEPLGNPFENNQPGEKDIEQAKDALDKEQQFKEALTERDNSPGMSRTIINYPRKINYADQPGYTSYYSV